MPLVRWEGSGVIRGDAVRAILHEHSIGVRLQGSFESAWAEQDQGKAPAEMCDLCETAQPPRCFAEASTSCRCCAAAVKELRKHAVHQGAEDVLLYVFDHGKIKDLVADYKGTCPRRGNGRRLLGKGFDLRLWFASQQPADTPGKKRRRSSNSQPR